MRRFSSLIPAPASIGIWFLGFGICLILLFFWKLAFTNLILARGDAFLYFYPYWDYRARILLSGHLPLWNPYLFMGAPFLANPQAGVLYPLNWPLVFFPAPVAIKISILLHLVIAASGAQLFARRALGQSRLAALLSALLFTLSGYLPSQAEHINQLQGLAWFPWLLLSLQSSAASRQNASSPPASRLPPASRALNLLPSSVIFAFILLAGHSQSAFIVLSGAILYAFVITITNLQSPTSNLQPRFTSPRRLAAVSFFIFTPVILSLLLASAQLLPSLELSRQSLRGGGLPLREALSFSLNPRLLGRALLPGYSRGLFSEFVAYPGVVGLALAALALPGVRRAPQRLALIALGVVGLAFALGLYNPLYAALAALPPFNLFRVPARWLCLFVFSLAMFAGYGLDDLSHRRSLGIWSLGFGVFLILVSPLANNLVPPGETGPLGAPHLSDLVGWLLPLSLLALLLRARLSDQVRATGIFILAIIELFLASRILPYNRPTTPDAYTSLRPAITQLLMTNPQSQSSSSAPSVDQPPPRFLSMSALRFDPGDLAELHSDLDAQLPPDAVYDAIVAAKNKEVLSPNLPLTWSIHAVDGFDGGILPLKHYAEFTALFTGAPSPDGRLRENIRAVPDQRLLALVNARYLMTDKVDDLWLGDVFYDRQFTLRLVEGQTSTIAYLPRFTATALGLLADSPLGQVQITFADGSISKLSISPSPNLRLHFDQPAIPASITLIGPLTLRGLSLIDERSGAFQTLTLGQYRLVHSGDLKIYDNLALRPRAFVVPNAVVLPDDSAARTLLADSTFDPASTVILASSPAPLPPAALPSSQAIITDYTPEHVRLTASGPGYLLLTDAYYAGWVATVDGAPAPILRADIMFRAVQLPGGAHTVEFHYEPLWVKIGLWVSGITWAAVLSLLAIAFWRVKEQGARHKG